MDAQPKPRLMSENAERIWDEYKYRHELIWGLVFKITAAVVAVSILPYALKDDVETKLDVFILALPLIGLLLTVICTSRIRKECRLLDILRERHRDLNKFENLPPSSFTVDIMIFFRSLILLNIANCIVVLINFIE